VGLAELAVEAGRPEEALALLARLPESGETRRVAALARLAQAGTSAASLDATSVDHRLTELLDLVKTDDAARQEYLDLLEAMDPEDERKVRFRRALSSRLF
jgi:putative thioredoxin